MVPIKPILSFLLIFCSLFYLGCTGREKIGGGSEQLDSKGNGQGYGGGNGQGYGGIINRLNGFAICSLSTTTANQANYACDAWVKQTDGGQSKAASIEAGVTLDWQMPTFTGTSPVSVQACETLNNGLKYQCQLTSDSFADLVVNQVLKVTQDNVAATSTTQSNLAIGLKGLSASDPILISDSAGLAGIAAVPSSRRYYKLTQDLNLGGIALNSIGRGYTPTDSQSITFNGHFDGNHKTISNFNLVHNSSSTGLFGGLIDGTIEHLTLANVTANFSIQGSNYVGALVGGIYSGTVNDCHILNFSIRIGGAVGYIGGIAGVNYATISNSSATIDYQTVDVGQSVAGIVSYNAGKVSRSYSDGAMNGGATLEGNAGGIVSWNLRTVEDSHSDINIGGKFHTAGGLVAVGTTQSVIATSYYSGNVTGDFTAIGGIYGSANHLFTTSNNYWVSDTFNPTSGTQFDPYSVGPGGSALTGVQLLNPANFVGFDFANIWLPTPGTNPTLR